MSVILTRTSVIYVCRVRFPHAKCDFYTQNVISTRKVWFLHAECNFHPQCDVEMHLCNFDAYDCDFNTHESDIYTQSVILTRMSVIMTLIRVKTTLRVEITLVCDVHTHTVMNTRTSVISEHKVWFQHAQLWFIYYAKYDFHTVIIIIFTFTRFLIHLLTVPFVIINFFISFL
jgi:hypothetical protein